MNKRDFLFGVYDHPVLALIAGFLNDISAPYQYKLGKYCMSDCEM